MADYITHCMDTLFGGLFREDSFDHVNNVCYLLDVSGSMYLGHDLIRKHLVDHLFNRADIERIRKIHSVQHERQSGHHHSRRSEQFEASKFNVVAFSDQVSPWADNLVTLTRANVSVCSQWVKQHLRVKTGPSYVMPSILFALNNPSVDQVVLVTDSLPADGNLDCVLSRLSVASKGRPIHVILVQTPNPSSVTESKLSGTESLSGDHFFIKLTRLNGGVLRKVKVDVTGRFFDDVKLVKESRYDDKCESCFPWNQKDANRESIETKHHLCHSEGSTFLVDENCHHCPQLDSLSWHHPTVPVWRTIRSKALKMPEVPSFDVASLLIDREVLARRNEDGFYHLGTVRERAFDISRFFVEFARSNDRDPEIEEVNLNDIINYEDALRNPIKENDHVMASLNKSKLGAFLVGTITEGSDCRTSPDIKNDPKNQVVVAFTNGQIKSIPTNCVIRISESTFNKLRLEKGVPSSERRTLQLAREDIDQHRELTESNPVCKGYPVQPKVCQYGSSCCCLRSACYIPVCRGVSYHGNHTSCHNSSSSSCSCVPNSSFLQNQDIIITSAEQSFVQSKHFNLKELSSELEKVPEPFKREGCCGWSTYQNRDLCCCHCESGLSTTNHGCSHQKRVEDSDDGEEFDEFLTDVRNWGKTRDAATSTDLSLVYAPQTKKPNAAPWRYWKRNRYEKPPEEQPPYYGDPCEYSATRGIHIKDTSGLTSGWRNTGHRSAHNLSSHYAEGNVEHEAEGEGATHESNYNERGEDHAQNESSTLQEPQNFNVNSDEVTKEANSADDKVTKCTNRVTSVMESGNYGHNDSAEHTSYSNHGCHRVNIEQTFADYMDSGKRDHVRDHWAHETNRYFDDIHKNMLKQKSKYNAQQRRSASHQQAALDLAQMAKF